MARDDRRSRARERMREQVTENKNSGGSAYLKLPAGIKFRKLEKGTGEFDILPFEVTKNRTVPDTVKRDMDFEKGEHWWQRSIFIHRNVGPEKKAVLCPRTFKKPCPICEERMKLMEDYDANEDLIRDLKPQHKDLMYVDGKDGVEVIEHSYANFREVIEKELREQNKDEFYDFWQLEGGYTLRIRVLEEKFGKNTFCKADRIDFDKRSNFKDDVLSECLDFDTLLVVLPYDKIQKIFLGLDDDEPVEEEKEEKTTRSSRREEEEKEEKKEEKTTRSSRRDEKAAEKEEKPARSSRREEKPAKKSDCPYDHEFGVDCDKKDECPDCSKETWEKCCDLFDELQAKRR